MLFVWLIEAKTRDTHYYKKEEDIAVMRRLLIQQQLNQTSRKAEKIVHIFVFAKALSLELY